MHIIQCPVRIIAPIRVCTCSMTQQYFVRWACVPLPHFYFYMWMFELSISFRDTKFILNLFIIMIIIDDIISPTPYICDIKAFIVLLTACICNHDKCEIMKLLIVWFHCKVQSYYFYKHWERHRKQRWLEFFPTHLFAMLSNHIDGIN